MKLNGWQRMWVAACVIYTGFLAGVVVKDYPSYEPEEFDVKWVKDRFAQQAKDEAIEKEQIKLDIINTEIVMGGKSKEIEKQPLSDFYPDQAYIDEQRSQHEYYEKRKADRVSEQKREMFTFIPIAWLIGCLGSYLAGWTIGWIIRGFRKPKQA